MVKSAATIVVAAPIMIFVLGKSGLVAARRRGHVRVAMTVMGVWLLIGVVTVILTPSTPGSAGQWGYPKYACEGTAPGSWPITKVVSKVTACISWSYDAMARWVGWDDIANRVNLSYGTMIAGLTGGAMNRDFLLQGVLLLFWVPTLIVFAPVAGVMFLVQ